MDQKSEEITLLPKNRNGDPVDRPLVDDLAQVLASTVVGWRTLTGVDLAEHPEVQRVMERYVLYTKTKTNGSTGVAV